jgi:hypothetical protein
LPDVLFDLFDEYALRYVRGEAPDPVPYLDRAGDQAGVLGEMLDRFLQWAPVPGADALTVMLMQAWLEDESPLRELRVQRGVRVDEVVGQLSTDLQLEPEHQGKLRRYFQRLERGGLDVRHVDARVFESLSHSLQFSASALRSWANAPRVRLVEAAPAFRDERRTKIPPAVPRAAAEEWDEVDELFLGPHTET